MDEREMLELAAKAAGYAVSFDSANSIAGRWKPSAKIDRIFWNPMADDGDALRLAVKLHMTVRCYMGNTCVQIGVPGQRNAYEDETSLDDPYAATRRTIVRAAAEIGKALP